jgi:hypothetical protein
MVQAINSRTLVACERRAVLGVLTARFSQGLIDMQGF